MKSYGCFKLCKNFMSPPCRLNMSEAIKKLKMPVSVMEKRLCWKTYQKHRASLQKISTFCCRKLYINVGPSISHSRQKQTFWNLCIAWIISFWMYFGTDFDYPRFPLWWRGNHELEQCIFFKPLFLKAGGTGLKK